MIAGIAIALVAAGIVVAVIGVFRSDETAAATGPPRFVEEAAPAGVDHRYDGEWTFFVGGGVAVFDCDDDGRPDLYFAGGSEPAALYRNESPTGGALQFAEATDSETGLGEVTGAYPIEIDGDGVTDLAVLRLGENVLLRGLGECRFERANETWSFDGGDAWTTAFSAKWEGESSMPTMAFGNYVALDESGRQTGSCSDHALVRPEAGAAAYSDPTPLSPGWCTLSILFSDWDRSGRGDLRTSNDRHYYRDGEEQLWRVDGGQAPRLYERDEGWKKVQIWGMGIATHDLTGDGLPEVFLSSQADNKLQTLVDGADRPAYSDIAIRRGVTAHRPFTGGDVLPSTAWHAEFDDVNNDGFVDLFIAKGNVEAMPEFAAKDPSNLLLGDAEGTFTESAEAAGIVHFERGRGAALVDLNLDGMLDLVEVNRREPVNVWRNVGWGTASAPETMGNWIAVRLEQPEPNPDAIGAWIEVRTGDRVQRREVSLGGGHAGGELGWIHFGLGPADGADVRVQWPQGETGPWQSVRSGFVTIERGADEPEPWLPPEG